MAECAVLFLAAGPLPFLGEVVALVVACAGIAYLCQRLHILPIAGFLVAGVVIGPHALGLVGHAAPIESIAELGVVLLLFTLGIEFSLERLWRIRRIIFVAGTLQVLLTIGATAAILVMAGVELRTAIFTGSLVALSSTAIILKVLEERAETASEKGQLTVGILIFQDLAVVALVLLTPMLAGQATSPMEITGVLLKAMGIVVVIVVAARRLMPFVLEQVARTCSAEIFLLTIVAICLGTAWLTNLAGVSLSLGAFLAGLVVSESRFSHQAFGEILPLQMLFSAAFFVSVGMLLDVRFMLSHLALLAGVVGAIFLLKMLATAGSALIAGRRLSVALAAGMLLAQVGEFSFVLQRLGAGLGLHPAGVSGLGDQMFIAASVVLMVMTPFFGRAARLLEKRTHTAMQPAEPEPVEERIGLENHVIIAGYGTAARYLTRVLRNSGVPFVILTLSPTGATEAEGEGAKVVRGNYSRRHLLQQANVEAAKMLVIPDDEPEMTRRVTAIARSMNPTLNIVARTHFLAEIDSIIGDGADEVIADEQEVAVQLFTRVLTEYQVSLAEVDEHVQTVRAGGYAALRVPEEEVPEIRCRDLDEECFDTRSVVVRAGSAVSKMTLEELATGTGLTVTGLERGGKRDPEPVLGESPQSGDRLILRGSAKGFSAAAPLFRAGEETPLDDEGTAIRTISLSPEQRASTECEHVRQVRAELTSVAQGCIDCLASGEQWVHLRICMTCGGVRCCDSSPNQHATKHHHASAHPVIRSYQPGELWAWCYPDEVTL